MPVRLIALSTHTGALRQCCLPLEDVAKRPSPHFLSTHLFTGLNMGLWSQHSSASRGVQVHRAGRMLQTSHPLAVTLNSTERYLTNKCFSRVRYLDGLTDRQASHRPASEDPSTIQSQLLTVPPPAHANSCLGVLFSTPHFPIAFASSDPKYLHHNFVSGSASVGIHRRHTF